MGILRSPHEATCPSIASRFLLRGRNHVILHHDISRQTCTPDRHGEHACPDRRSHRRGFCRRSAADSRRHQAQPSRTPPTGAANLPAAPPSSSACAAQSSRRAPRPGCGMPTSRPKRSKAASKAGRRPSCRWCRRRKLPPRDAQGRTVWVTRARPKIDRIACPWLIRRFVDPERGVPVRGAVRGGRGRRALQRRALRYRERVLEPPRRALHLRRDDRGVRPRDAAAAAAGDDGARRRYRAARSLAGSARPACGFARPVADVSTTISNSSRPACCCTTPSIAGAAMRPAKPTTGRPTRRSRRWTSPTNDRSRAEARCRSRHQLR